MKLVPLGDRVVLKQLVQEKRLPNPESFLPAKAQEKTGSKQKLSQ